MYYFIKIDVRCSLLHTSFHRDVASSGYADYYRNALIALRICYAGGKLKHVAVNLVEHKTIENAFLTDIVVQYAGEKRLCECLLKEHAIVVAADGERGCVVKILLTVFIFHFWQTIACCAQNVV